MSIKPVIRMGHPTLKKVAEKITPEEFGSEFLTSLINDLFDTMKHESGLGIAAPQINVSKQVAVIELPESSPRYDNISASEKFIIINPEITYLTSETQGFFEGCLSVPTLRGFVERPKKIKVNFFNELGEEKEVILEGFLATVFQHELDHLFGILYVERITDLKTLTFNEEFQQFQNNAKKSNEAID